MIDFHCSKLYKDSYLAGNGRFDISDFVIEAPLTLFDEEIGCTLLAAPAEFSFLRKMGKKTISVNNSSVAFIMTLNIPSSKHLGYAEGLHTG